MNQLLILLISNRSLWNLIRVSDECDRIWLVACNNSCSSLAGTQYMATLTVGKANSTSGYFCPVRHSVKLGKDSVKHS